MSGTNNRVEFGVSEFYIGTYEDNNGTITLGSPYHQEGATSITLEPEGDQNSFFADNKLFWGGYSDNGYTGSATVAKFDDEFKKKFLGYKKTTGGGLGAVKNAQRPNLYFMFQAEGDAFSRKFMLYNVAVSQINREFNTIEDSKEPTTESIDFTVIGDNSSGLTINAFKPGDAAYDTLFTTPQVPGVVSS